MRHFFIRLLDFILDFVVVIGLFAITIGAFTLTDGGGLLEVGIAVVGGVFGIAIVFGMVYAVLGIYHNTLRSAEALEELLELHADQEVE